MLVQSTIKDLYLLPALPRDKWANGCVKGLKARGGMTVNICWKEGDLHEVGLWSKDQNSLKRLHYRGATVTASISSGRVYTFNRHLKCVKTFSLWEARGFFLIAKIKLILWIPLHFFVCLSLSSFWSLIWFDWSSERIFHGIIYFFVNNNFMRVSFINMIYLWIAFYYCSNGFTYIKILYLFSFCFI